MPNKKKYNSNVVIGLLSLFLAIPSPTLIHEHFNSLIANGYINFLYTQFDGFEAQMLVILMSTASVGLFAIAIYSLGNYLISLGSTDGLTDD